MLRTLLVTLLSLIAVSTADGIPKGAICENKATGFFVIDNTALTSVDSIVYKDTAEDDCLTTCSRNRDQYGRSVMCASFVYDHNSLSCTIYKEKIVPDGEAQTESVVGKRYFEKVCLNDNVPMHCADSQFIRADNSILVGFAYEVSVQETIEECVGFCAKNATCKSALYYYEEKECILNTETAISKPDGYQKENNEKVIYFQNGCPEMKNLQIDPTMSTPLVKKETEPIAEQKATSESTEEYEDEKEGSAETSAEKTTQTTIEATTTTTTKLENSASAEEATSKQVETSVETVKSEETNSDGKSKEVSKPVKSAESAEQKPAEKPFLVEKTATEETEVDDESDEDDEETTPIKKTTEKPPSTKAPLSTEVSSEEKPQEQVQETTTTEVKETTTKKSPTFVEQSEYEEEEEDEDSEEFDNLPVKTVDNDKNPAKASYTKYNKHPRNFASKTVVDKSGELQEASSEETAAPTTVATLSQETSTEQLSDEQGEEPKEAETKPTKKNRKNHKKHHVAVLESDEYEEPKPFPNYFSEWSDWTPCTKSGERQIRRRKCLDLRKCLGALMQVQNCPAMITTEEPMEHIESVRSIVGASGEEFGLRDVLNQKQPRTPVPIISAGAVEQPVNARTDEGVWSQWLGTCQQFASGQPCNDGKMIGFESRECVAKDPSFCVGPFFRYCEIAC